MGTFAPLAWDETGKKLFETGVSNVALYPQDSNGTYGTGVAWNGVTTISDHALRRREHLRCFGFGV